MPSTMTDSPAFDLYSSAIDADPFPYYQLLRDRHPCYWADRNGAWILSRYQDVLTAAQDWRTFSSTRGNMIDEIPGRAGATLGTTDPPRHDRLRALTQAAFSKKSLEYLAEPTRRFAQQALEPLRDVESFDFVAAFSSKVTVGVLFHMLGLPVADPAEIRAKVILSISTDKALRGRNAQQLAAFSELGEFISEQVAHRRSHPQDDLITALACAEIDGERLSEREVVLTTATFVMAGVESLSSFMSMFALNMHDLPDARRRVTNDWALLGPAIEESLRYNTSAQRFKRTAMRDIELHGQTIRAGDKVVLAYGSANRDPRKFVDADVYDVARRPHGHLGFGAGPHSCLGSHMARLVTASAMRTFLEAFGDSHRARSQLDWVASSNFRSPVSLHLTHG
jgi:cytochrome P450